jgi:cellulose biosynthesis protein BcsQ
MKTLPIEFEKSGWRHRQLKRCDHRALYKRMKDSSTAPHYEVFRVTVNKERVMGGTVIPESEHYPSANDFGKIAWAYPTFELAIEKYKELTVKKEPTKGDVR